MEVHLEQPRANEGHIGHHALLGAHVMAEVEDEIPERIHDEGRPLASRDRLNRADPVRVAAEDQIGAGVDNCRGFRAFSALARSAYSVPQCGITVTRSAPAAFAALTSAVTSESRRPTVPRRQAAAQ